MALWGEPGVMIDACIHLPLMTLQIKLNNQGNRKLSGSSLYLYETIVKLII